VASGHWPSSDQISKGDNMSRVIRNDHLWTDEEVAYKLARCLGHEVAANRKMFGPGGPREGQAPEPEDDEDDGVTLSLDQDIYEHVLNLKVEDLKAELKQHNLSTRGNEQELRSTLAQYLQDTRDANDNE